MRIELAYQGAWALASCPSRSRIGTDAAARTRTSLTRPTLERLFGPSV